MSERREILLDFIKTTLTVTGAGPTYSGMQRRLGIRSHQAIENMLSALIDQGYITVIPGKKSGIKLTRKGDEYKKKEMNETHSKFDSSGVSVFVAQPNFPPMGASFMTSGTTIDQILTNQATMFSSLEGIGQNNGTILMKGGENVNENT